MMSGHEDDEGDLRQAKRLKQFSFYTAEEEAEERFVLSQHIVKVWERAGRFEDVQRLEEGGGIDVKVWGRVCVGLEEACVY
ncbi:hypothetical protein DCAR_0101658 [Daucus carota subsp. sativus]|uniref:Uncharacterized protein n=1 Tax=Daucus carota subsp. sativus TaxID=79200 RepID=A0A166GJT1_DAUCS|nr:hypothetical protein DCAR_0101658 [Daucus carota subsp. sativus]